MVAINDWVKYIYVINHIYKNQIVLDFLEEAMKLLS